MPPRVNEESVIVAAIRKDLGLESDLVLWRLSQGLAEYEARDGEKRKAMHGLVAGASDLIGLLTVAFPGGFAWEHRNVRGDIVAQSRPFGRFFALEAKTPQHLARILSALGRGTVEKLSQTDQDQIMWGDLVRKRGGFYAFVDSVDSARAALHRARKGELG